MDELGDSKARLELGEESREPRQPEYLKKRRNSPHTVSHSQYEIIADALREGQILIQYRQRRMSLKEEAEGRSSREVDSPKRWLTMLIVQGPRLLDDLNNELRSPGIAIAMDPGERASHIEKKRVQEEDCRLYERGSDSFGSTIYLLGLLNHPLLKTFIPLYQLPTFIRIIPFPHLFPLDLHCNSYQRPEDNAALCSSRSCVQLSSRNRPDVRAILISASDHKLRNDRAVSQPVKTRPVALSAGSDFHSDDAHVMYVPPSSTTTMPRRGGSVAINIKFDSRHQIEYRIWRREMRRAYQSTSGLMSTISFLPCSQTSQTVAVALVLATTDLFSFPSVDFTNNRLHAKSIRVFDQMDCHALE
ncbi:hypothetical protein SISNIDRAFT_467510 [Sistotremastrum niveocremeum HHB9708]|uniref:Uncharacterized protein n=1 Tax=Sistotremastrum niveocremeum HHB9708 TaxID=1314777 RepID=A0A164SKH9_9AGAM|nr:hypothetical protein SISNIDRAFT_467510 [Sistotremastrum niveocremeum HHB9708]